MSDLRATFHWADYLIFVLTLLLSAAIGVFYAWRDRKKTDTTESLLGGRSMSILPVTLSLMATLLSATLVLGIPTDIYYNGTMYWLICFSSFLAFPVIAHAILPVFRGIEVFSAYEYLELRFSKSVRVMGSILFQIQMLFNMAITLYAPALAVSQVMDVSTEVSIVVVGVVCTFYTAVGGLKAVMWTDTFQMVVIFAGLLAIIIRGSIEVGGWDNIMAAAREADKLRLDNFDPSPFVRYTFWSLIVGGFFSSLTIYGSSQAMIQRYLSMKSTKRAQIALYLNLPAALILTSLMVFLGLVVHAKYYGDDPVLTCRVEKPDQIIPLLVMDVLGEFHGLPGLFVACIFSAALSTVSSGVNALAAVFLSDILEPAHLAVSRSSLPAKTAAILSKVLALVFGAAIIGLALLAGVLNSLVLEISLSILGIFGGPLLGLFILGMFLPCSNSWGAGAGFLSSVVVSCWVAIGSTLQMSANAPPPPVCANDTVAANVTTSVTTILTSTPMAVEGTVEGLELFYNLSFMWYSALGVMVSVVVGVAVSCATGGTRKRPVEARYLSPWYVALSPLCQVAGTKGDDSEEVRAEVVANGQKMSDLAISDGRLS
ncbi:sodium-dependent multivitamin transporter-like [Haliotis rufescens]|uniref:sodium-dependent multivitamin transporter-like n=1 Tax=Haliotis rufescens TaxID=6454 RepID=UPI00201F25F1|nr:sodium-dependent multivitamin transporter-like [Haliotis rufescens]